jgi:hypothetical protein
MQDRAVNRLCRIAVALMLAIPGVAVMADEAPQAADDAELRFFESRVRPVLVKHCYDCHSTEAGTAEGGLRVDSRQAIRQGGENGPAVVPGEPDASLLLKAVSHADPDLKMPPKQRLSNTAIADLRRWIETGAPDPRDESDTATAYPRADADFWAYQPVRDVPRPSGRQSGEFADWPRRDLDHFILDELERNGLAPSPDAAPETLLRRVYFDLIGLPPSPDELEQFQRNVAEEGIDAALEDVVDRLLDSPRFGERWGRHWLDVARFGESTGMEANIAFPYAWRYRDYVIDCFNDDVPYDRFLTEQIAGDLLPHEDARERARLLIATGFLALGPKNLGEANEFQFLADVIDEQIDTLTRAVTASSVACARCHDHKFDPFSMEDYYALAGIFVSTETYFGTIVAPSNRRGGDPLPLPEEAGHPVFHASIPKRRVERLKEELADLEREREEGQKAARRAFLTGKDPGEFFSLRDALRIFWRVGAIEGQLKKVSDTGEALPLAMGVLDRDRVIEAPLLERGEIDKPGETVPRRFPKVLQFDDEFPMPEDQSGRLELARWLTHPDHPLTSRVLVNRVWKHLFGAGLVRTVDNFGSTGERPSHPGLLDDLAGRFVRADESEGRTPSETVATLGEERSPGFGWSIKKLVRELVLSRAYRQASDFREEAFLKDPENRLLWRASKRRLEAEAIRDAMLAASGELDLKRPVGSLVGRKIGDRPISLIGLDKRLPDDLDGSVHRSVYLPVIRDRLPDVLDLFDFAEPSLVTGERETTNVPLQALYLLNSPFVMDRAESLAARLMEHAETDRDRVHLAYRLSLSRLPDEAEEGRILEFLGETGEQTDAAPPPELTRFCQALLCTAEFRNLD